jgi:hypothetical protein
MLYKYCDTSGFDILRNSRLRLSKIDGFNDPFELVFGIDEISAEFNIRQELKEDSNIIHGWIRVLEDEKIAYDNTSQEDVLRQFIQFQIGDFQKAIKVLREEWSRTTGIVCMSDNMDIIQMWAHYSDGHKGIVIGIEENEFIRDRESIITVCYRDKMVLLPVTGHIERLGQYAAKYIPEVLARKETHWGYEKEIRLCGRLEDPDADGHYYFDVPSQAIKEIYLGLRSNDETREDAIRLKERAEYRHLRIYKMNRHESAYALTPQELSNG